MKSKSLLKKIKRPARLGFLSYLGDTQGCGTIRVIYPYFLVNHFREKDLVCFSTYLLNFVPDPGFYQEYAAVQFQRSCTEGHYNLIMHVKKAIQPKHKVPVIYEIDDMLFDIPNWNYASIYYNKAKPIIEKIMSSVDGIVTSTETLKEKYSQYCKRIEVIPNHLPKFIWGDIYPAHDYKDENEKIKILWAGSQNHFAHKGIQGNDAKGGDFGEELLNFIRKTADVYEWHLQGAMPVELSGVKNKIHFHKWKNIFEYPRFVKSLEPDICIAPLLDDPFNHCKSRIKALEYSALGAVGVYSNVTPYYGMQMTASTDEEMISHIEALANDIDLRAKVFKKDLRTVSGELWWEENNNVRKYIETYLGMFGKRL